MFNAECKSTSKERNSFAEFGRRHQFDGTRRVKCVLTHLWCGLGEWPHFDNLRSIIFLAIEMLAVLVLIGAGLWHPVRSLTDAVVLHPVTLGAAGTLGPVAIGAMALAGVSAAYANGPAIRRSR